MTTKLRKAKGIRKIFLLCTMFLCFLSFTVEDTQAACQWIDSNFRVIYNPMYARFEFTIRVKYREDNSGGADHHAILTERDGNKPRISVRVSGYTDYSSLFFLNVPKKKDGGKDDYDCGYIELTRKLQDGALWHGTNGTYKRVSGTSTGTYALTQNKTDDFNYFHTVYWYPSSEYAGKKLEFSLNEGKWDIRSSPPDDTNFNDKSVTREATMEDKLATPDITSIDIQKNGNTRVRYQFSSLTNVYPSTKLELLRKIKNDNKEAVVIDTKYPEHQTSSYFEGKYITDNKEYEFYLRYTTIPDSAKYTPSAHNYVFIKSSELFTATRLSSIKSLEVKALDNATLDIIWTYDKKDDDDDSKFIISVYNSYTKTWVDATKATQGITVNNDIIDSFTYPIPAAETQKGVVDYTVRVHRNYFNQGVNSSYFERDQKVEINTNYKAIDNFVFDAGDGGSTVFKWDITKKGLWNPDLLEYKLEVTGDGVKQTYTPSINEQSCIADGLMSCVDLKAKLSLIISSTKEVVSTDSTYFRAPDDKPSKISNFTASKGYYPDKVELNWTIPSDSSNFSRFIISRKNLSTNVVDSVYQTITADKRSFIDENIETGVYYGYRIGGFLDCGDKSSTQPLAKLETLGFSQPYGVVSGRITYNGDQGVKGVDVLIKGDENVPNRGLVLSSKGQKASYIKIPTEAFNPKEFTFSAWISASEYPTKGNKKTILRAPGIMELFVNSSGNLAIKKDATLATDQTDAVVMEQLALPRLDFTHLAITAKHDSLLSVYNVCIFNMGEKIWEASTPISIPDKVYSENVFVGAFDTNRNNEFDGFIDEIRFHSVALDSETILDEYDRFLNGKDDKLSAYYRCDENTSIYHLNYIFDISRKESVYNKRDAYIGDGVSWSYQTPSSDLLTNKAKTDENGNYLMNTVPYTNDGILYTVTPMFKTHSFNPNNRPVFVSPDSRVINNLDFTDNSSFPVSGRIVYENTDIPVEKVTFYVDGQICMKNNTAVTSAEDGTFTIDVPIGEHSITIKKEKHTFVNNGRYPADDLNAKTHNFNSEINNLTFYDNTTITVAGKVAGGSIEADKPLGLGDGIATIGQATIELQMLSAGKYMLNNFTDSIFNFSLANQFVSSKATVEPGSDIIRITTDSINGEFVFKMPPVAVQVINVYTKELNKHDLNYESVESIAATDLLVNLQDSVKKEDGKIYKIDYNHAMNINYRKEPTFIVKDVTKSNNVYGAFGEEFIDYIEVVEKDGVSVVDTIAVKAFTVDSIAGTVNYTFGHPVFLQLKTYRFELEAFEEYFNRDDEKQIITTKNPLAFSKVYIDNELSAADVAIYADTAALDSLNIDKSKYGTIAQVEQYTLALDSVGFGEYEFAAGFPNVNSDYTWGINIKYKNGDKDQVWDQNGDFFAYIFGNLPTGTDFITKGPDEVHYVLRDPPGSNSLAVLEEQSIFTGGVNFNLAFSRMRGINYDVQSEMNVKTAIGIPGAYKITEQYFEYGKVRGLDATFTFSNGFKYTHSTVNTKRITTAADALNVGASADVFIGNATNIVIGTATDVGLIKQNDGSFIVGDKEVDTMGSKFSTEFVYTSSHIERSLIPELKESRNNQLIKVDKSVYNTRYPNNTDKIIYITTLDEGHPYYGRNNNDNVFGDPDDLDPAIYGYEDDDLNDNVGVISGKSYIMIFPKNFFDANSTHTHRGYNILA
ncbi:hypothetical protein M2138_000347 [Dysgonomonadaceae bacterium PH5-43]|nr:hypothetical protein [Dysgonomonadaceae bacterium PH5-43]